MSLTVEKKKKKKRDQHDPNVPSIQKAGLWPAWLTFHFPNVFLGLCFSGLFVVFNYITVVTLFKWSLLGLTDEGSETE